MTGTKKNQISGKNGISQLRHVGSHNTCLGSVAQGAWQLDPWGIYT